MAHNGLALNYRRKPQSQVGFSRDFDSFFDNLWSSPWSNIATVAEKTAFKPRVDIINKKQEFLVVAELPGLEEKDIDIALDGDQLVIRGEKKAEERSEDENSLLLERSYGSFERRFNLPEEVDKENITANFTSGVLKVKLPKSEETKPTVKKIAIAKN